MGESESREVGVENPEDVSSVVVSVSGFVSEFTGWRNTASDLRNCNWFRNIIYYLNYYSMIDELLKFFLLFQVMNFY